MTVTTITSKQRVLAALNHQKADRHPFWLGHPTPEVIENLMAYYGAKDHEDLLRIVGDDFRWKGVFQWNAPDGRFPLDMTGLEPVEFNSLDDVEAYAWPDPAYADVSQTRMHCEQSKEYAIYGGSWSHFFHQVWDLMGPQTYLTKMLTDPELVEAITERVVDFHFAINEKIFKEAGDLIDLYFFGNDLGTQRGPLISRELFLRFIKPGMVRLIEQARSYGLHIWLHSCGSIRELIPDLIEMGVEAIHPVQVSAAGMEAADLGRAFRGQLTFIGGVDVHYLMRKGTPEEVRAAVRYNKEHLGPGYVVSPSHEAVLPDIPIENLVAMIEEAMI